MSDGGDCRTAPATPGLLKTYHGFARSANIKKSKIYPTLTCLNSCTTYLGGENMPGKGIQTITPPQS